MNTIDKTLNGSNFCGLECVEQNSIIHPETCISQVLTSHNDNMSLLTWIDNAGETTVDNPLSSTSGLLDWLTKNYPINQEVIESAYTLPKATTSVIGGVKIDDTYLTINNGTLGINVSSLNIPTINTATSENFGVIKLGYDVLIPDLPSVYDPDGNDTTYFPLRIDSTGKTGIGIKNSYFAQTQVDWNTTASGSISFIKNKPNLATVATTGSYNDLTDKPEYVNVMHYKGTVLNYAALEEIESPGLGDVYNVSDTGTNYAWSGTAWDALGSTIDIGVATSDTLGLIKVGYNSAGNRKAVQLDSNNRAFVELQTPTAAWISNGLSQHYFKTTRNDEHYIKLAELHALDSTSTTNNDSRKICLLFRIVSRFSAQYFGEFYINMKYGIAGGNISSSAKGSIMTLKLVSGTKRINDTDVPFLQSSDIVVTITDTFGDNPPYATIYRKIRANMLSNDGADANFNDVFIFDVLGDIDKDSSGKAMGKSIYYCTEVFNPGSETLISINDAPTSVSQYDTTKLKYLPS